MFSGAALCFAAFSLSQSLVYSRQDGKMMVRAVADDVVRLDFTPASGGDKPTDIVDPRGIHGAPAIGKASGNTLSTKSLKVSGASNDFNIQADSVSLQISYSDGTLRIRYPDGNLYGMRGIALGRPSDPRLDVAHGIERNEGAKVSASAQGDGGAPLAYSAHWGVVIDSVDGEFAAENGELSFKNGSRKSLEAYVVLGAPERTIEIATLFTGKPPMPPKWSLGFMNSQWGSTEDEVKNIVAEYRRKQIPFDAFILDFDFKAWG